MSSVRAMRRRKLREIGRRTSVHLGCTCSSTDFTVHSSTHLTIRHDADCPLIGVRTYTVVRSSELDPVCER